MQLSTSLTRLLFLFSALALLSFSTVAQAQNTSGIGLSPSLIESGAEPGETLERTVTVRNLSGGEEIYYLFTRDISGVQNGGSPIFADRESEGTGYELSEWVTLDKTEMTIGAGDSQTVNVKISVPDSATPGSHFGGIFVSKEPPRLRENGAGVGYQVANIVSIRVAGDVLESAQIRSLSTDKLIYGSTNVTFDARIENKGNVLVRPFGPLEVYNMFGSKVAAVEFNDTQSGIFPNTIRDFQFTWEDEGLGFGRYEGILTLVYGEQGRAQSSMVSSASFWVLPMQIIQPALVVLGIILIGAYIGVRIYVNRAVQRMSGGRRIARRQQRGPSVLILVSVVMMAVTALFLILLLVLFA